MASLELPKGGDSNRQPLCIAEKQSNKKLLQIYSKFSLLSAAVVCHDHYN